MKKFMMFVAFAAMCVTANAQKWGFVDKTGKVVIPFKFKKAYPFEHGKARVQDEHGNWRKIDKTGKFIE